MKKITLLTTLLFAANTYAQECQPGEIALDFESVTAPALPACSTIVTNGGGNAWVTVNNPGNGFSSNTLQYTVNTNAADTWFFTPGLQMTAGTHYRITYKYGNNSAATTENLTFTMGTAPDVASAQTFTTHAITGGTPQVQNIELYPAPASGMYYFGFHATSDAGQSNIYLDDIVIEEVVCGTPTNIAVDDITDSSASVSWEAPTGSNISIFSVYQYAYGTNNTPPANGTFHPATSVELSGLDPQTTYYLFTRSLCGPVWSDWTVTPFTTQAVAGTIDVSVNKAKAYPNPVNDVLHLSSASKIDKVAIYTLTGQLVFTQQIDIDSAHINTGKLAAGPYIVHAFSGEGVQHIKIMKQ